MECYPEYYQVYCNTRVTRTTGAAEVSTSTEAVLAT